MWLRNNPIMNGGKAREDAVHHRHMKRGIDALCLIPLPGYLLMVTVSDCTYLREFMRFGLFCEVLKM